MRVLTGFIDRSEHAAAQRRRAAAGRRGRGEVPQDQAAELRRLRRAAVLRAGPRRLRRRHRRRARGALGLRGRVDGPGPFDGGLRPARLIVNINGSPVSRRQAVRAPRRVRRPRAGDRRVDRVRERGRRSGRAGLRRRLDGGSPRRRVLRTGRRSRRTCSGRRPPGSDGAPGRSRRPRRPWPDGPGGGLPGARARSPRLRAEERVPRSRARPLGRHRLGAGRDARGRRPRARRRPALAMPSPYSSPESLEDAPRVARRLGIRLDVVPIEDAFRAYLADRSRTCSRGPQSGWPRRTSRRGSAGTS